MWTQTKIASVNVHSLPTQEIQWMVVARCRQHTSSCTDTPQAPWSKSASISNKLDSACSSKMCSRGQCWTDPGSWMYKQAVWSHDGSNCRTKVLLISCWSPYLDIVKLSIYKIAQTVKKLCCTSMSLKVPTNAVLGLALLCMAHEIGPTARLLPGGFRVAAHGSHA